MPSWKTSKLKRLSNAFLSLKKEDDMMKFLRDLCTIEELEEMSHRWEVALLLENGLTYREIAQKTGMSTTTITRIAFWVKNGEGGYEAALNKRKK